MMRHAFNISNDLKLKHIGVREQLALTRENRSVVLRYAGDCEWVAAHPQASVA
jgi:hypothetical protein